MLPDGLSYEGPTGSGGTVAALIAGRAVCSAGFALVMLSATELLLTINNGNHARAQRISSRVGIMSTVLSFLLTPAVGGAIDALGRKPALIIGPVLSAVARVAVALAPSNRSYIFYRLLSVVGMLPMQHSLSAALADAVGGRGTPAFATTSRQMWMVMAAVRMIFLRVAARLRTPRRCYLWGAVLSAAGAATFALTVQETLPCDKRKPFELRKLADPLSFIRFFSRTPELRAVALLHVLQAVPTYNEVLPMYRKQVFGWGVRESATMAQLLNLTELVKPVVAARVLQSLGTRGTAAWGSRLDALAALNVALTGMPSTTYLNPVITSVCDQEASLSQVLARAADAVGAGDGETLAASSSLSLPLGLICPTLFTELYVRGRPRGLPFIIVALIHALSAQFVVPLVWRRVDTLGPTKREL